MSRSRRRTPIIGIAARHHASDKKDKSRANRKMRRAVRSLLRAGEDQFPHKKEVSDPWVWCKDGKMYFDSRCHEKYMRK